MASEKQMFAETLVRELRTPAQVPENKDFLDRSSREVQGGFWYRAEGPLGRCGRGR